MDLLGQQHLMIGVLKKGTGKRVKQTFPPRPYRYAGIRTLKFESMDTDTLIRTGRPVSGDRVKDAFRKTIDHNNAYNRIAVTGNFVLGDDLPVEHNLSLG